MNPIPDVSGSVAKENGGEEGRLGEEEEQIREEGRMLKLKVLNSIRLQVSLIL